MSQSIKVLIVDDEELIRLNLRALLEDLGYVVAEAANGREGLETFDRERPDLVLADLRMPVMDGLSMIAGLREKSPETPVIVVSGTGTVQNAVDSVRLGAWDYVIKPVENPEEFEIILTRALERAQLIRDNRRYREHLEDLVRERAAALRESETRYRRLLESVTSYVYTVTVKDGRPDATVHGPGCEAVTGFTPEEYAADPSLWRRMVHDDDRPLILDMMQRILDERLPLAVEHRLSHKDGAVRWVHNTLVPHRAVRGELLSYDGIVTDITERKQAEEELQHYREHLEVLVAERTEALEEEIIERKHVEHALQQAKDAAEAANRAKSVFLANMSHELRTPLNAILGFARMLGRDPHITALQQEYLDIILRSGEHLLTLINNVLEIARIEAGRIELHSEVCEVGVLIRDVIDMMRNRADAKQLSLTLTQSTDLPRYIQVDASKLRQILVNLISNAIKFTQTGGVTVRVRRTCFSASENETSLTMSLRCEVEDTGIGIAAADQERIFTPFEQTGIMSEITGTGLGLAITHQYLCCMGGTVMVESTPGSGSIFRFEIPVQPVSAAALINEQPGEKEHVVGLEPGQPRYRLVIAEDHLDNRLLLTHLLESVGFDVREAANGVEAIQVFQEWQPQAMFMDRRMPGIDGLEATRRIKALAGGGDVVIIMLTASAFTEQRDEAFAAGVDGFIRKPFREMELFEILRQHLGVRYVYAEQREDSRHDEEKERGIALTPDTLAALPPDLLDALEQAALQLDMDRMSQVIAAIRSEHPDIAERLAALAKDFRCKEIWSIIQQTRQQE